MRGPSYLSFNDNTGFKFSVLPNPKECSAPFFLTTFGKMFKERDITRDDSVSYIIYSNKGCGEVLINEKWEPLDEGSLVYFPPTSIKNYRPVGEENWETIFFVFNGKNVVSTLGNNIFIADEDFSFVPELLEKLRSRYNDANFKEYAFSKLYYLILILARSILKSGIAEVSPDVNSTIGKSIKSINASFTQDLPISQIAEASGVTREYFCKLFKEQTGQTCTAYINELRINRACDIMTQNPHKKIEDISRECGFRTLTYFNRVFKQRKNTSPSEFRQNVLKSKNG